VTAISTLEDMRSLLPQRIDFLNPATGVLGGGAIITQSLWGDTTLPVSGTTDPGNTTTGIVPTSATLNAPFIQPFSGVGYLTSVTFTNADIGTGNANTKRLWLFDRLFHVGRFTFGGLTTLSGQPSFAARLPNGSYSGLRIYVEESVQITFPGTVTVTYTNENGVTGRTTSALSISGGTLQLRELALQAGDYGVQKIESVNATGGAGAINVLVLRTIWAGSTRERPHDTTHGMEVIGLPQIWSDSCLMLGLNNEPGGQSYTNLALEIRG